MDTLSVEALAHIVDVLLEGIRVVGEVLLEVRELFVHHICMLTGAGGSLTALLAV